MPRSATVGVAIGGIGGVLIVLVALALADPAPPPPQPTGIGLWPDDYILNEGERAVGHGQLVARENEPTRLCTGTDVIEALRGGQYRCSPASIRVDGVDVGSMAGVRTYAGAFIIDSAVVRGAWDGLTLHIDALDGQFPSPPLPQLRCERNVPGAVAEGPASPKVEAAYQRLQTEVATHPDAYGGQWVVTTEEGRLMMVAVVGHDPEVGTKLRTLFPYPLCLATAQYSSLELGDLEEALRRPDGTWQPEVSAESNRVLVRFPVLDSETLDLLAPMAAVEPLPLLVREGPR